MSNKCCFFLYPFPKPFVSTAFKYFSRSKEIMELNDPGILPYKNDGDARAKLFKSIPKRYQNFVFGS